jgi:hypothetical protein
LACDIATHGTEILLVPVGRSDRPDLITERLHKTTASWFTSLEAVAEHKAKAISERTKAALTAAKRRGVKLGGYRGTTMTKAMRRAASEAITKRAKERAVDLAPTIAELQAAGATSLRAIAAGFNERGIRTPRGTNCWRGWPNRPRPPSYHLSRSMTVTVRTQ